jgi:putative metalloenzyme radical SAM/SPASM domain maturase
MCVKQSSEAPLAEGNLSFALFERLTQTFENLQALILTGIGEPLLHPELERMISLARQHMLETGWIGFQTNGSLLDRTRARSLIEAGTDKICVSVDSLSAGLFRLTRACGELSMVDRALEAANQGKKELDARRLQIGIEFVLMKSNCRELARVIAWAAERGASFVIATQMLPYHEALQHEALYSPNLDASMDLFQAQQEKARERGVDLRDYFQAKAKTSRSLNDSLVIDLMGEMISEAHRRELFVHLDHLIEENGAWPRVASQIFAEAKETAQSLDVELLLPALRPRKERRCSFVENGSAFVSWQGTVHPCYFLWHRYTCFQNGSKKYIEPKSFGDLTRQGIMEIWNSQTFVEFREAVLRYDYPYCGNCNITPCDLISAQTFQQDCFGSVVPCGDCPWSIGLLQCLH